MTQAKIARYVTYVCVLSLLLPIFIARSHRSGVQSVKNKMSEYLQVSPVQISAVSSGTVKAPDEDKGFSVPESNLPGQSVGGNKNTPAPSSNSSDTKTDTKSTPSTPAPAPKAGTAAPATPTAGAKAASSYVVKDGDTYGCIAERYYGSFDQYPLVMAANYADTVPGYSEYFLHVGAKLTLPAVSAADSKPVTRVCN